jgi:chromosome segregation ATPase
MTRDALDQYNEMIRETTADLEAHLQSIDDKLAAIANHPRSEPDPNAELSVKRMEEERQSAQQCILICESARSHIQSLQDEIHLDAEPNQDRRQTAIALSEARDRMVRMITDLQERLVDLSAKSVSTEVSLRSNEFEKDRVRLLKEIDTAKQCLEVCNMAADQASKQRVHVFGDVSAEDNAQQIIVSTVGDLLNAKNIKVGNFSSQWLGSMTDASLQQLSIDRTAQYTINTRESDPSFGGKYGSGYRLNERGGHSAVGVGRTK